MLKVQPKMVYLTNNYASILKDFTRHGKVQILSYQELMNVYDFFASKYL